MSDNILIVDDEPTVRSAMRGYLVEHGYAVFEAHNADAMRRVLETTDIDIILLDVMLPGENGLSIGRWLANKPEIGIIMISAMSSESDRIIGLEVGADDYLPKPVSPRELLARIRALQRRYRARAQNAGLPRYFFETWQLDTVRRVLLDPDGVIVSLSDGEFGLLFAFVEHPQRVLSRDQLLDFARGQNCEAFDRAIDVQVSRLRKKLDTRLTTEFIRTVRNEGYLFIPRVERK